MLVSKFRRATDAARLERQARRIERIAQGQRQAAAENILQAQRLLDQARRRA